MANAAAVAAALAGDSERNETLFFSRLAPALPPNRYCVYTLLLALALGTATILLRGLRASFHLIAYCNSRYTSGG